jgi:hypothetical protein
MGDPDRRNRQRRKSDTRPAADKKSEIPDLIRHLFTPSLDPIRSVMPTLAWLSDSRLPRRVLAGVVALLLVALGYAGAEVKAVREIRDAEIDRLLRVEYPSLKGEVAVLKIEVAAIDGQQARVETKVEKMTDKIDEAIQRLTHIQATLNRQTR